MYSYASQEAINFKTYMIVAAAAAAALGIAVPIVAASTVVVTVPEMLNQAVTGCYCGLRERNETCCY